MVSFVTALLRIILLGEAIYETPADWELLISCTLVGVVCIGALNVATVPRSSMGFIAGWLVIALIDMFLIAKVPFEVLVALTVFIALLARSILSISRASSEAIRAYDDLVAVSREHEHLALRAETARVQLTGTEDNAQARANSVAVEHRRQEVTALAAQFERTVADAVSALGAAAKTAQHSTASLAGISVADTNAARRTGDVAYRIEQAAQVMRDTAAQLGYSADAARISRPDIKVLFITGYAENPAVGNGLLDACMEVITKPFNVVARGSKVREMLDRQAPLSTHPQFPAFLHSFMLNGCKERAIG